MAKHKSGKRIVAQATETETKDKSPFVYQRDKLRTPLNIRQRYELTPKQRVFIETALHKDTRMILCDGIWGSSKAQPLDANILTPTGWVKMGDIKEGDYVVSGNGKPTKVVGVYPQGEKDIYRVTFSDDSTTECCEDHLWATQNQYERNRRMRKRNGGNPIYTDAPLPHRVRTLKEIKKDIFVYGIEGRLNHSIPMVAPVEFEAVSHYIHPYVMGVLLGDGGLTHAVSITNVDREILDRVSSLIPDRLLLKRAQQTISYHIINKTKRGGQSNPAKDELIRLGLHGKGSCSKFIPTEYLFDSIQNRIELLKGLMDTDGGTSGAHHSYSTCSPALRDGVIHLVESLGGTAVCCVHQPFYIYKGQKLAGKLSYRISIKLNNINPFFLSRKANKVKPRTKYFPIRYFKSIELIGKKEAQCIRVEDESHLYVTDRFIVTHNTFLSVYCALELLNQKRVDSIVYLRSPVESGKGIGFIPGTLEEKINPYAEPLFEKLHELLDGPAIKMLEQDNRIEVIPPGFIRGRSWNCKAIIVDEAANFSRDMLELILSRIGPFCKVFVIGSHHQSDTGDPNGFMSVYRAFDDEESRQNGIFTFSFNEESDIVRSDFMKLVMRKLGVLKPIEPIGSPGDWVPQTMVGK